MGMFKKPAADGLSETFNLEEGIPVFRAALSTDKLRGESFRGKNLKTVSLQTGKVKTIEPIHSSDI